jgi:hypothetical protein
MLVRFGALSSSLMRLEVPTLITCVLPAFQLPAVLHSDVLGTPLSELPSVASRSSLQGVLARIQQLHTSVRRLHQMQLVTE